MKQGTGKHSYEPKTQPVAKSVSPGAVSQIGAMVGTRMAASKPLYNGRGFSAPVPHSTVHKKGSQNG